MEGEERIIKETVEKIDKAIPDEVKEQAKKLATKENLEKEQAEGKLDLLVMLFTDVMGEGSLFVFDGPLSYVLSDIIETKFDDHSGFDPHIISRKQQLMPKLSAILKNI